MSTSTTKKPLKNVDSSTVILGFTGSIGSGSSYISEMIPIVSGSKKYKYYKLSEVLRAELAADGVKTPGVKELQDKGNDLRSKNGNGYLVARLLERIDAEWDSNGDYGIIIDGIKNEGEVLTLRNFPNFYLFSIQADRDVRCRRVLREGTFPDEIAFNKADERDEREEFAQGQQVKRCNYLADIVILNETDLPKAANRRRRQLVHDICERYVKLIENLHEGLQSPELPPSNDELCMTMAYVLSKSSSCLKRKVGAIVVDVERVVSGTTDDSGRHLHMPIVVSSGYNEVPTGSFKCVFNPDYQMCYRDHLQEQYADQLTHCPKCGTPIKLKVKCEHCGAETSKFQRVCKGCGGEIETKYTCPKCELKVFARFVPGAKESPGKLLDMCKALHAEEVALLKLAGRGLQKGRLALYATTQPCNLCSNKIVSTGISEVVFDEPYSMREGRATLENAGVTLRKFQGIKSTAYFKLYR